ncbi:MAG: Rid family detoxifying hydrolase [Carnobacterium sp.]|uniref:Rid family detoxifying hydrolase n=3 Tax=Carnobacterium TaxID=2747 RepID=A0ABW4NLK2_9LACT
MIIIFINNNKKLLTALSYMFIVKEEHKEVIYMQTVPSAIGPYSAYRKAGNLLFTSGQLPIDPKTNQLEDNFSDQCKRSLMNIQSILEQENLKMEDIVKVTVLLKDLSYFEEVNRLFEEFFQKPYPTRTAFEVSKLPKNALIEIEAIAFLK